MLDYIQSSGTQYINTGINAATSIDAEIKVDALTNKETAFLGVWSNKSGILFGYYNSGYAFAFASGWGGKTGTYNTGFHIMKKDGTSGYFDGTVVYTNSQTAYAYPIYIFKGNVFEHPTTAKIAYCKLWDNDVLVRDYVPVIRKDDTAIGLYDKVNDKFYSNDGSGTFTAGSIIGMIY